MKILALLLLLGLLLAGCNAALPAGEPAALQASLPEVCLLPAEPGGASELDLLEQAWQAVQLYETQGLLSAVRLSGLDAAVSSCHLVVLADASQMDDALLQIRENGRRFVLLDAQPPPGMTNGLGLTFDLRQPAMLAGYLAAGMSKTETVGVFGESAEADIIAAMAGFARGVELYNDRHGTTVQVLGWDSSAQSGLFTGSPGSASDGRTLANVLLDQDAGVIFAAAGEAAQGALEAVRERGEGYVIGYNADLAALSGSDRTVLLTAVEKRADTALLAALDMLLRGNFQGGTYSGSLANGATGLVELHPDVPAELEEELAELQAAIISGRLQPETGVPTEATPQP